MNGVLESIKNFFSDQDTFSINIPLLITVVSILFISLVICILVSKKYKLYNKPKYNDRQVNIIIKDEVA